jgi:hypothetical protein
MLKKGMAKFEPAETPLLENKNPDPGFNYRLPEGGLILTVTSKVLSGYEAAVSKEIGFFQNSLGRDVLWMRKDEQQALVRGELMDSLKRRLAMYNLIDNTRGEPHPWTAEEIRKIDLTLKDGVISGSVHLANDTGSRSYTCDIRGHVEAKDGKLTRFDLVAKGPARGASGCTEAAKPKGEFTLAVACRIASGQDEADKVMPQGAKSWFPDYMR